MGTAGSTSTESVGQVVKTIRFRRDRASKACEVCHTRKVRCDMTENFPCTNCRAFSLVCTPRKGRGKTRKGDNLTAAIAQAAADAASLNGNSTDQSTGDVKPDGSSSTAPATGPVATVAAAGEGTGPQTVINEYVYYPTGVPPDISASESKRLNRSGENVIVQPSPLINSEREGAHFESDLPEDELVTAILNECTARVFLPVCDADFFAAKAYGSFLIPSAELSDHLIDLYFTYVHPTIPVLNRREFLEQYREDRDKPSLLVRQAIWCVSSRLSDHPGVIDNTGTSRRTSSIFYRRAKALFDVNYERDQANIICTAIILSLAVSNPLYFNNSSFYWIHLATTLAQAIGYHRKLPKYTLDEQRQQRRIWWTIYRRDVTTSMAYGRPNMIRLEDCDVAMVTEDDFIGSETASDAKFIDPNSQTGIGVAYFLHSVRLHEILALIMHLQFTVSAEWLRQNNEIPDSIHCEHALAEWVAQIPPQLRYNKRKKSTTQEGYDYLRSLLHLEYYTVISLSHRPQIALLFKGLGNRNAQQSAAVAFQSTHMILKIMMNFREHGEVRKLPGSTVYTLFCAVFMLSSQRRLGQPGSSVHKAVEDGLNTFRDIARELAKSHSAASWVALLAEDLQSDKLAQCISKSMRKFNVENAQKGLVSGHKSHLASPSSSSSSYMNGTVPGYGSGVPSLSTSRAQTPTLSKYVSSSQVTTAVQDIEPPALSPASQSVTGPQSGTQSAVTVKTEEPSNGDASFTPNGITNDQQQDVTLTSLSSITRPTAAQEVLTATDTPPIQPTTPLVAGSTADSKSLESSEIFMDAAGLSFDLFPPEQILSYLTPDFPTNLDLGELGGEDMPSTGSSSDEAVPDTMSMADWYAFLNNDSVMGTTDFGGTELGDLAM